jgi:hypothetical protein
MWPYQNPTVTCNGITGNTLPPVACNWNGMCNGNTGMAPAGQLPTGGDQSSYEAPLNVTAVSNICFAFPTIVARVRM